MGPLTSSVPESHHVNAGVGPLSASRNLLHFFNILHLPLISHRHSVSFPTNYHSFYNFLPSTLTTILSHAWPHSFGRLIHTGRKKGFQELTRRRISQCNQTRGSQEHKQTSTRVFTKHERERDAKHVNLDFEFGYMIIVPVEKALF